jgi:2-polyprenyl-6-methoxyphenol hydroxylase-like FAD-dependent oxidoreductase
MGDIAIVGSGIGGLCTAIALRDRGFDPVVYEAVEELRPIGFGIGIMPNGICALLLGDAAHAMTPNLAQGSAQAMEDAIVLADSLEKYDITRQALDAYESRRKERVERILRQSRLQGRLAQMESPILTTIRNVGFRYMPSVLLRWQMERLLSVDF